MKAKMKLHKLLSMLLALVMVVGMLPAMSLTANAVNASSVTITASDGTQTVIAATTGTAGDPWSYDAATATLTLNNWTGQKISANGDLNLHLVGINTITIPSSTTEVVGIDIGSSSSMSSLEITADTGGTLNINGTTQGDFYGIRAYTYITNGTVNIDITSSGSNDGYGMWGNVRFTKNETRPATLNIKVTDTSTTGGGYVYAICNASVIVENRSNVTVNAEAHVSSADKYTCSAIDELYIYEASPVITATADCPDGASTKCLAVGALRALGLTAGGKVTANGMVGSYYLPDYLDANVVTTTPANNNYLFRRGTDLGIKNDTYYYMCGTDGSILNKAVFEYSEDMAEFKWVGGNYYDIPGGMVGDRVNPTNYLLAGLRGADGLEASHSNTEFEILSGSLPSGLTLHNKGGIFGTVTAPCEAGTVTVKATDTNDSTRTVTFTINYGAFVEPDKYLTIGVYDTTPKEVEMKTSDSGTGWSYDGTTKTLTLNGYNGGPIAAENALNLHLVGTNTITMPSSTTEVVGIDIGSSSSMSSLEITADTGGTLNINGTTQGDFYGIRAYTYITNGTVNIDITSSGSNDGYGMWGNVRFTKNETRPATLNIKVTDTSTTGGGYVYAICNASVIVENRSNVTVNAEAHVSSADKYTCSAIDELYIYEASPVITATADCPDGASTKCLAVGALRALGLTAGGKVTANGMVGSYYLPDYLDANVVTTTPANNNYLFRRGTDLGIKNDTYYYMCGTDGSILNKAVFEYSEDMAEFKWVGGNYYDIPGGMVGDRVNPTNYLLAGLRGADGLEASHSNTEFEILSGSLPSGLTLHNKGGIFGTVTAPCEAGSVTVKATDTNDSTRTVTFIINYGKFASQKPVTDMTLDKTEMILEQGATETVTATVTPADASYPDVKAVSSDTGIATVSVGTPSGASSTVQVTAGYKAEKATVTVTSVDSSLNRTFDVYVKEKTPTATFSYYNETLNGLMSGRTYAVSGTGVTTTIFTTEAGKSTYPLAEDWLGKEITLVLKNDTYTQCDSNPQTITLPARPDAPTGLGTVGVTAVGDSDGKITGVNSYMEYRKAGETSWNAVSGSSINGLAEGTYEVRLKSTSYALASKTANVVLGAKATYSVIFDKGEGTGTMASGSCQETLEYTLPTTCDFTPPTGKVFTGWQIGSTVYNPGDKFTMPSNDVTVTAVYTAGVKISGTATSFNSDTDPVTIQLIASGMTEAAYEVIVNGNTASYYITGVTAGTYTMKVMKKNHVTREYTITVGSSNVMQDVKIHLKGDINGDGKVNTSDVNRANLHAKGKNILTGYEFACADVNGDGKVNTSDVNRLNLHSKKKSYLW